MRRKNYRFVFFLILFIIPVLSIVCKQKSEIYRFIDHLDVKNIVSSPLIDLEDNFDQVELELDTRLDPWLGDKEGNGYLPLNVHILGWNDSLPPAGMKVLYNGKELEFRNGPHPTKKNMEMEKNSRDHRARNIRRIQKIRRIYRT